MTTQYEPPLKLTSVLSRQAVKSLILAWMNEAIEIRECDRPTTTHYFSPEEFGRIFETLNWSDVKRIKVTIEPELK